MNIQKTFWHWCQDIPTNLLQSMIVEVCHLYKKGVIGDKEGDKAYFKQIIIVFGSIDHLRQMSYISFSCIKTSTVKNKIIIIIIIIIYSYISCGTWRSCNNYEQYWSLLASQHHKLAVKDDMLRKKGRVCQVGKYSIYFWR